MAIAYLMLAYVVLPTLWNRHAHGPGLGNLLDRGVGLSHYTGQVAHRIGPNTDAERDFLMRDLTNAGLFEALFQISGLGPMLFGRNGGGDPYYTDEEIDVGSLVVNGVRGTASPALLPPPPLIALKDQIPCTAPAMR